MPALTAIGEIGIETGGRSYLLRPSLFSMTQIGTPAEIIQVCAVLMTEEPDDPGLLRVFRRLRFDYALSVLYACAGDQDLGDLVGGLVPANSPAPDLFERPFRLSELASIKAQPRYMAGTLPMESILAIARSLIRHGVMGNVEPTVDGKPQKGDYLSEFKAVDYAATAMAHLGLSESQAWGMTMTTFIAAMRSKFPREEKQEVAKPHTAEEYDAVMAKLKKINEMRAGKT
jgi:hypothetical protein